MNCPNCDLPLADGPPQTCPRCYATVDAAAAPQPAVKPRRRRKKSRKGRQTPESPPASEPGTETEQD
jgi:hypothetical protein